MSLYSDVCKAAKLRPTNERKGQALMNALHSINPKMYEGFKNTLLDCFYDDRNIVHFKEALKDHDRACQT